MVVEPIVKWSGSKRSQAEEIVKRFPRQIDTYYEPFCGGCSVLYRLLQTPSVSVKRFVASDINADLIALWNEIKNNYQGLCEDYARTWRTFNKHGFDIDDIERRKEVFYTVRDRLNEEHKPADFLFILRTTTNGMPRYNAKGEFNNSCHFSRPGIDPSRILKICRDWNAVLNARNVEFRHCSYDEIESQDGDLVYMDPPYASLDRHQMYFGGIDLDKFFSWLGGVNARWVLSFDGTAGEDDFTYSVPKIYSRHEYLESGISGFRNLMEKQVYVRESLYMNFTPELHTKPILTQGDMFS